MIRPFHTATLIATLVLGRTAAAETVVVVTIEDVRSENGALLVEVLDSEDAWKDEAPPLAQRIVTPVMPETTFELALVPGAYGIRVYQDLDEDRELDTNAFGLPREPYGFSNDARGRFGPPRWSDARLEVEEQAEVQRRTLRLEH